MQKLWTKNFTLIIIGTIISSIGSQVILLPISLLVFEKTESTLLSGLMFVVAMIPNFFIPIFISPIIDNSPKKAYIVSLDFLLSLFYMGMGLYLMNIEFNYAVYMVFAFIMGMISAVYQLAYGAWYPELIPKGQEQKGFAVSGTIYPSVTIIFAPVAAYLYEHIEMYQIFWLVGFLLFLAGSFECFIEENFKKKANETFSFARYLDHLKEGFAFFKREHGIRNIYIYMGITNGIAMPFQTLYQAFFQTSAVLTATLYGFLKSAETIGRLIGGIGQYTREIEPKKRFTVTKYVYLVYEIFDAFLLFLPYPLMLVNRFICGILGMTSMTLRKTAVQSYLPSDMRARVNAVFNAYVSFCAIIFQLVIGFSGDLIGIRPTVLLFASFAIVMIYIFIIKPKDENEKVYQAVR